MKMKTLLVGPNGIRVVQYPEKTDGYDLRVHSPCCDAPIHYRLESPVGHDNWFCTTCNKTVNPATETFTSKYRQSAVTIGNGKHIAGWVSVWTGLPEETIEVTVT